MKRLIMAIVCLMTMVIVSAHNTHFPTYTIDGITYVATSIDKNGKFVGWDILKINKPYAKTIIIPYEIVINGDTAKVGRIRENAFSDCVSLDSLIITDGLYLGEDTFRGCKGLEYIYYSSNTSSWHPTFNKYTIYPDLVCKTFETTIGVVEEPFWKSITKTLKKLIIRENSEFIFANLRDCKNLETIICYPINPPSTGPTTSVYSYGGTCGCEKFASDQWNKITLYVPRESLEKYYFNGLWGEIDNIYAIDEMKNETFTESTESSDSETTYSVSSVNSINNDVITDNVWYSINGAKVNKPTKGIYIKNGKKYVIH